MVIRKLTFSSTNILKYLSSGKYVSEIASYNQDSSK